MKTQQFTTKRQWLVRLMGAGLSLMLSVTPTVALYAQTPVNDMPTDQVMSGNTIGGDSASTWPEFAPLVESATDEEEPSADPTLLAEVEVMATAAELAGRDYPEVGPASLAAGSLAEAEAVAYTVHVFLPLVAGAEVNAAAPAMPAEDASIQAAAGGIGTRADFNGDGYVDLAVGAPGETLNGQYTAGAVNVIYGSSQGLKSAKNQFWHQDSPGILGTAEADDNFGSALATGDFNADGYGDLAVGAPGEDSGRGVVHILYGTAKGLKKTKNQVWTQDTLGAASLTPADNERFGTALATGDFNHDGYVDLAIGSPYDTTHGGAVQVLYGSAAGLAKSNSIALLILNGGHYGWALAAGDFDNKNGDDLAISAPSRYDEAGQVVVIYGSNSGLNINQQQIWRQGFNGILGLSEAGDHFGWALTTGDFNGDNFKDLAIGSPYEDVGSLSNAGVVNIIYGSATGLSTTGNQVWAQDSVGVADSSEAGDFFGFALSTGRLGSDSYSDLIIGAPQETLGNDWSAQGMAHVFYGGANGLTGGAEVWHQDSPNIADASFDYERFGYSLRTGDFDNDGLVDLAIGVPNEDEGGGVHAGAVHVLYSQNNGLSATDSQYWTQNSAGILDSSENDDYFGMLK